MFTVVKDVIYLLFCVPLVILVTLKDALVFLISQPLTLSLLVDLVLCKSLWIIVASCREHTKRGIQYDQI